MSTVFKIKLEFDVLVTRIEFLDNDVYKGVFRNKDGLGNYIFPHHKSFNSFDHHYSDMVQWMLDYEIARHAFDSNTFRYNLSKDFIKDYEKDRLEHDISHLHLNEYELKKGTVIYVMKDQYLYRKDGVQLINNMLLEDYMEAII